MIVCGPAYIPSTTPSSSYRGYLLRLDPDGSLDRSFSPRTSSGDGSDGFVTTAAAQPDGRILVVGYLQGARRLYRLNPDG